MPRWRGEQKGAHHEREELARQGSRLIQFTWKLWRRCPPDFLKDSLIPRGTALNYCKMFIISGIITSVIVAVVVIPYCNAYTRSKYILAGGGREGKLQVCFKQKVAKLDISSEYSHLKPKLDCLPPYKSFCVFLS